MTMTKRTAALFLALQGILAGAIPVQVTINQRGEQCLYDKLEKGESVTQSVFILSGAELRAVATLEGPVAPPDASTGTELQKGVDDKKKGTEHGKWKSIEDVVDFEHFKVDIEDDDDDDDDDDKADPEIDDAARAEKKRKRALLARQKAKERRMKKEEMAKATKSKIQDEGEPYQVTLKAESAGWYRACVRGSWYQIVVEMEMRKESDLGGIDKKSGHVFTYEGKAIMDEEKVLAEDTASEEGIKDEDFMATKAMLGRLRRLLSDIQSKQTSERRRLVVHAATNEHSHSRMVLSSLLETVLFMVVTGFQVYTIRKWFSGAPVLGR